MKKEDFLKDFKRYYKDKQITKHEGSFSSLLWGTAASSLESPLYRKYYPNMDFGPILCLMREREGIGFFNFQSYLDVSENRLKKYLKKKESVLEFKDWEDRCIKIEKKYLKNNSQVISGMSDEYLVDFIRQTFVALQDAQIITLFCEALDENIVKRYFEKNKRNSKIELKEFFEVASLVYFDSFLNQLDSVLINFDKNNLHLAQWALSSYLETPSIKNTSKLIRQTIKEKGGVKKIKEEQQKLKLKIKENVKIINNFKNQLSGKLKDLFEFTQETIKMRDLRKKQFFYEITLLSNGVREFFRRKDIPEEYILSVLHIDFMGDGHQKEDYFDELKKRKNGTLIYYNEKTQWTLVDYFKTKKEVFKIMDKNTSAEIKGNIAQKGHAVGRAKVILSQKDFNKFKEGEILVTSMTRPEFVPLMKRAIAIVTDEGGLTCHASIVSRELGKPCVIGTQSASRKIRDGDLIEVDANNGVVKILKND